MAKKSNPSPAQELQTELHAAAQALRDAYEKFNQVSEPELVDACVYEINALKARYSYLLRRYKEISVPAADIPEVSRQTEPCVAAAAMKGGNPCHL